MILSYIVFKFVNSILEVLVQKYDNCDDKTDGYFSDIIYSYMSLFSSSIT